MARDVSAVERVVVPIRGDLNLDAILAFPGVLLNESQASMTLFHASLEGDEDPRAGEILLKGAADELLESGVDADRIETVNVTAEAPVDEILGEGERHDVLTTGEADPSFVERILEDVPSRILDETSRSVIVVRKVAQPD
jgi:nucleotide-binding universal stress UspA family protein